MFFKIVLLSVFLMANHANASKTFTGKVSYVTDGDTLWVQLDRGGRPRKLRIEGIDAPEICQSGGNVSRAVLTQHVLHKRVVVIVKGLDIYGRGLARVQLDGNVVGAQMVRAGQSWSYHGRRNGGPYAAEEAAARQSGQGLFAAGQPELPRDFRKRHGSCYAAKR